MKRTLTALLLLFLSGCATGPVVDTRYHAITHESRVRYVVIHYTEADFQLSLDILTGKEASVHYLVRRDPPEIYRLVDENRRAWHAGAGSWGGNNDLNSVSIGIEIVNRGPLDETIYQAWEQYPDAQMDLVVQLVADIVRRHNIKPDHIIGHSDLAPQRKIDPGPLFPWKRFADAGLMKWPDAGEVTRRTQAFSAQLPDVAWFQRMLRKHGFAVPMSETLDEPTRRVIAAFQMKYRPERYDGIPDAETAAILDVLVNP